MDNTTTIRLELGIDARKMVQQVQVHNEQIETEISNGIQLALDEILKGDNLTLKIKDATIKSIDEILTKVVFSWQVRSQITKLIEEKIAKKVEEYADGIAEKVCSSLK